MIKWLQDSYNGLYKVLLEPVTPRRKTVLALIVGILIGLLWAYVLDSVVFYDADPNTLHQTWQNEWVKMLADRNAASNADVSQNITLLLREVDDPVGIINSLLMDPAQSAYHERLRQILPLAETAQPTAAIAPQPSLLGQIRPFLLAPLIAAAVFVILTWLYLLFIKPNLVDPLLRRSDNAGPDEGLEQARRQMTAAREAETSMKMDFTSTTYGKPLLQRMSVYIPGRGQFDDSFSIEDEQERFLGECGAAISETIGIGDPAKVTAVEVWLFDKDHFVRTLTGVIASEHAYNDPGLRAKLEPKAEPKSAFVLAKPGAVAILETPALRLQARVVEVEYGAGPLPPNSFFQKLTLELAAWRSQGESVPASPVVIPAAAAPPVVEPRPAFQPLTPAAPAPPSPPSTPTGGFTPLRPAAPPPLQSPTPATPARPAPLDEDDPFGGTGDFRPIR
jgi:hypothetical protein